MLKLAVVQREGLPGLPPDLAGGSTQLAAARGYRWASVPAALELGRAYQGGDRCSRRTRRKQQNGCSRLRPAGAVSAIQSGNAHKNGLGGNWISRARGRAFRARCHR